MPWFLSAFWRRLTQHQMLWLTGLIVIIVFVSAGLFAFTQHLSYFVGLYWAVTTITTVGYGDVTPHNTIGRLIAMGTMLTAIPLAGVAFGGWAASLVSLHIRRLWEGIMDTTNHPIVVLGYDELLAHILPDLQQEHDEVVWVTPTDLAVVPESLPRILGDPTHPAILRKARLTRAQQLVVLGPTDGAVLMTAVAAHHAAPEVPVFAITASREAAHTLKDLGMPHSIARQDLLGHTVAKSLLSPHAADFFIQLLTDSTHHLQELPVPADWQNLALAALPLPTDHQVLAVIRDHRPIMATDTLAVNADDVLLLWVPAAASHSIRK